MGYAEPLYLSAELDLIRNGLVSSISGVIAGSSNDTSAVTGEGLQKLAMLNQMLGDDDEFWSKVKEFRRVMLLRTVLTWPSAVKESQLSWIVSTEVLQLFRFLLPSASMPGDLMEKGIALLKESLQVIFALN